MYNFWLNAFLFILSFVLLYLYHYMIKQGHSLGKFLNWFYDRDLEDAFQFIAWIIILFNIAYLLLNFISLTYARRFEGTYEQKKTFLEYNPENEYETAMFRNEKLEVNETLFNYQWRFEKSPNWTFVTEEIMEFEPIK